MPLISARRSLYSSPKTGFCSASKLPLLCIKLDPTLPVFKMGSHFLSHSDSVRTGRQHGTASAAERFEAWRTVFSSLLLNN